ncbi:MAG TPA: hypothetical protein VFP30_00285 [Candidatus Limnocylindria bacterium]|nr:hypothetical protein [Candidatus Limnocylindria bacterium]
MNERDTGAPTDLEGGMPVTEARAAGASDDPLAAVDADARARFAAIADRLIPAAHGMPSAADVVRDDRLRFVLRARPDLAEPFAAALRPQLGDDVETRLATLEREEPANLAALQLVLVGGYYTDKGVRDAIGYPGQLAIEVRSWEIPPYLEEGLIDAVLARGQVWRDPNTGQRAVVEGSMQTYAERYWPAERRPEGGDHGGDGA